MYGDCSLFFVHPDKSGVFMKRRVKNVPTRRRRALRKVLREVHRVVQKPDDLHGARRVDPVEENVPSASTALADVKRPNPRTNVVTRLAAFRIDGDGGERLLDQGSRLSVRGGNALR